MTAQILEIDGRKMAVLPMEEYERLLDIVEDKADSLAAETAERRRAEGEEYLPAEMIDRLIAGESALKVWRKYRGLTQDELARRAKTTFATVSRLEAGKMKSNPKMWNRLAEALDVSVGDILPADL
jgi:DNA-binding XRE family transcriptional regulator